MTLTDRDEASFTFVLHGTAEAHAIGRWAQAAFLPPEMFHALLQSVFAEWREAGSDPSAAAVAEVAALVAYRGKEASARGVSEDTAHCFSARPGARQPGFRHAAWPEDRSARRSSRVHIA